ncbi:MAG: ATP-dependent helicase [Phycisphaerales bacterium]
MHEILDSLNSPPARELSTDVGSADVSAALLAGLTEQQKKAVTTTEGPVLVLAAAGSGKTRVITRRVAWLLSMGVPPWQILALTFTNKAAGEMRERVNHLITEGPLAARGGGAAGAERLLRGLTVTTFHALCARLLRKYAGFMEGRPGWGLKGDYTIYDSDDQASLVKRVITDLGMSTSNWPPRTVLSHISAAKNDLMDAAAFTASAYDFNTRAIAKVYEAYERALRAANAVDFDDLLVLTVRMLKESDEAREEVQGRWRYLMIDEYQDTNKVQFVLSTLLVGRDRADRQPNVCVVGDPDQSIYGWRGADISNILDFEDTYAGAKVIPLGENFRSRAPILHAADTLIRNNKKRKHKDLFTKKPGGEKPRMLLCRDERHEAHEVMQWLRGVVAGTGASPLRADSSLTGSSPETPGLSPSWRDTAVFYRNNSLSRVMEDALRAASIPYVIARGTAFYQREEVKDAIAYLRVVANPADDVSLRRIVNKPARKIGPAAIERLDAIAAAHQITLFEAMRQCAHAGLGGVELGSAAVNAVRKFVGMVDGWTGAGSFMGSQLASTLHDLVSQIIKESGLEEHYKKAGEKDEADADKVDNLDEVVTSALEFEQEYDAANDPVFSEEALKGGFNAENAEAAEKSGERVGSGGAGFQPASGETQDDAEVDFLADLASDGEEVSATPTGAAPKAPFVPPLLAMLRAYLESVSLVADADKVDPERGAVTLMTLHAAKGLEFHAAAIIGLEEGLLPSMRAMDSDPAVEEERRLMFVGITRAMEKLIITSAKYRTQRGLMERTIPSRFLSELPKDGVALTDLSDESSSFGARHEDEEDQPFDPDAAPSDTPTWGKTRGTFTTEFAGRNSPSSPFPVGSLVRHPQFGVGRIEAVTGIGANTRARISFRDVGPKTLVLQYARLEPAR